MKTKKLLTGLLSTVLTLTLCQGFVATFANTDATEIQKTATLTKTIQMDSNTTTPDTSFSFNVEKVSVDGVAGADMPNLNVTDLSFNASEEGTLNQDTSIKTVTKSIDNIIPDVDQFPHAGHYIYKISENNTSFAEMTYDTTKYQVDVEVYNTAEGGKEIGKVTVSTLDSENAKTLSNTVSFLNTYNKTAGGDPEDENNKALLISNTVTGNLGDKTKDFNYEITVNRLPAFAPVPTENDPRLQGVYTDKDGRKTTVNLTLREAREFTLKHGETLSFAKLPVGTSVSVVQTSETENGYDTSVKIITKGGTENADYEANLIISEAENKVEYTNNKDTSTVPTGIISNNLPFFGLIVLALGGFVCLVALRRKYNS